MHVPGKTSVARVVPAASLAIVLAAAGCTGSSTSDPSPPARSGSPVTSAEPAPGLPSGVKGATSLPTSPPNRTALRRNVSMNTCQATKDGWTAGGRATNPGSKTADYTITVFFTTTAATVVGSAQTRVRVTPGAEESWTAGKKFTAPGKTLCVLRGVG
jgi:hypothetical protein